MTIVSRPSGVKSSLVGAHQAPARPCTHTPARFVHPWSGEAGTAGRAVVVGAGKMGLPIAVQFARHGWHVTAVDVNPDVVAAINAGRSHVVEESLAESVAEVHAAGRLKATADAAAAVRGADVAVLIVPVMLTEDKQPDYRYMDAAVDSISGGIHAGVTVIFETTLPIGVTRGRFAPKLEGASGLKAEAEFFVAFSPERLSSGEVFADLSNYPKLVGGIGPVSTGRAAAFYSSVLDAAEIVAMESAEAAEFTKLAETTYRDVNIALANEFARVADRVGVNVVDVIDAANSQPYSHIHRPGIGVGGHCIPVYPHLLLSSAPDLEVVSMARHTNDAQVGNAIKSLEALLGGLDEVPILVLGLTYRENVKELAYSRALPLIERLSFHGADVMAFDPLLSTEEIERCCARPYRWGQPAPFRAIVTQTADKLWEEIDFSLFPKLEVILDGRNSLRGVDLPANVRYTGIGVQAATRRRPTDAPGVSH